MYLWNKIILFCEFLYVCRLKIIDNDKFFSLVDIIVEYM